MTVKHTLIYARLTKDQKTLYENKCKANKVFEGDQLDRLFTDTPTLPDCHWTYNAPDDTRLFMFRVTADAHARIRARIVYKRDTPAVAGALIREWVKQ